MNKKYAITIETGAVIISAPNKTDALNKFIAKGFDVKLKDVYIYNNHKEIKK